jgi:hypothetical protein
MKKTLAWLFVFALAALPATAARKPPPLDMRAVILAQAQQNFQKDQMIFMTQRQSFRLDRGAHKAELSGTGSAILDSGSAVVRSGVQLNITINAIDDPAFQDCADALAQSSGRNISLSGKGTFTVNMQNNEINTANVTLNSVASCDVGQ